MGFNSSLANKAKIFAEQKKTNKQENNENNESEWN